MTDNPPSSDDVDHLLSLFLLPVFDEWSPPYGPALTGTWSVGDTPPETCDMSQDWTTSQISGGLNADPSSDQSSDFSNTRTSHTFEDAVNISPLHQHPPEGSSSDSRTALPGSNESRIQSSPLSAEQMGANQTTSHLHTYSAPHLYASQSHPSFTYFPEGSLTNSTPTNTAHSFPPTINTHAFNLEFEANPSDQHHGYSPFSPTFQAPFGNMLPYSEGSLHFYNPSAVATHYSPSTQDTFPPSVTRSPADAHNPSPPALLSTSPFTAYSGGSAAHLTVEQYPDYTMPAMSGYLECASTPAQQVNQEPVPSRGNSVQLPSPGNGSQGNRGLAELSRGVSAASSVSGTRENQDKKLKRKRGRPKLEKPRLFPCPYENCKVVSKTKFNFETHIENVHERKRPRHECPWIGCDQTVGYGRLTDLRRHYRNVHSDELPERLQLQTRHRSNSRRGDK
ncbi:hypothetical protein K474DRAFT_1701067 [Panus rudis PR-1116 ss-1]|nr:hypothetical protein K474DRAFT_1701067 [Panus rudis PR-1116 ss-1]